MKLLAIDGNSIVNRAFYGIKILTTKDGLYTNALFGFTNILLGLIESEKPDAVAVAFDIKAPTFRHQKFTDYKAGRKPMPEELKLQMPILKELLKALGIAIVEKEGYEADDIIGTLSALCEKSGNTCIIATGDRDAFQLVSDKTKLLLPTTRMGKTEILTYTPAEIKEKYGVKPSGMIEIKALQGDSSDNIPGVAGIGEKGAMQLISEFGSIDYIYENLDSLDIKDSLKLKLQNGKESAYLSRELGTICRTAPISENLEDYLIKKRDDVALAKLLTKLEFHKFLSKFGLSPITEEEKEEAERFVLVSEEELLGLIEKEKKCNILFFVEKEKFVVGVDNKFAVISSIKDLLENAEIEKSVYNSKIIYKYCLDKSIDVKGVVFDSILAAYLINPLSNSYEIERLATVYNVPTPEIETEDLDVSLAAIHSVLCKKLEEDIVKSNQSELLSGIELPLARVLAKMENVGFLVDPEHIKQYGDELAVRIKSLEESVWEKAGEKFNLNSPKQLGVILFEKLRLPCSKKTKSGYSTSADVLEELKDSYEIVAELLEYRSLTKLKSTYCDALVSLADQNNRIHSTLNQTETRTGRISSSEPNLQNIPVRTEEGRVIRKFFKAKDGFVLCDADYSQIELRVLAHIAEDAAMIDAFVSDIDIHTLTASEVFSMPVEMVTPLMRRRAKAVNFGIVYGIGAFSLAKDIGVSRKEADEYIKSYLRTYPQVAEYMERVVQKAREDGFVSTIFNRRRDLPELRNSNKMLQAFGERVARNMPIQGTAADIIKLAMIRVDERLEKEVPEAKLIMQVHDELIIEAPLEKAEAVCEILETEMENAVKLKLPLSVDAHFGKTWYDAKG